MITETITASAHDDSEAYDPNEWYGIYSQELSRVQFQLEQITRQIDNNNDHQKIAL